MADDETQLARLEGRTPDAYEREYMASEGTVLFRSKKKASPFLTAAFLVPALGSLIPALVLGGPMWALAAVTVPVMLVLWMLFLVLRVTISTKSVNVQYGLFGPKIPIAAITSAEATSYEWTKFGGWGIRRKSSREWIYNMMGDGGQAVRICWRGPNGEENITWIGSKDASAIAAAIDSAQEALPEAAKQPALRGSP